MNLLGRREPDVYGHFSLDQINRDMLAKAKDLGLALDVFQSNHEGEIVDRIGSAPADYDVLIINPAAYTHTSIAIRDAISACGIPAIEVHLSNIYSREDFRHHSMIAPVALGQISGFGANSYLLALDAAKAAMEAKKARRTRS